MILHTRRQRIGNVAYRGVLSGPALPGTAAAIRIAYLLGLPALVDDRDQCSIPQLLQLVANSAINRFRQPGYAIVESLPTAVQMRAAGTAGVFAIVRREAATAWPVWCWRNADWEMAGVYLPATASLESLAKVSLESVPAPMVIYEAPDVVSMYGGQTRIAELDEELLQQAVRSYAGFGATIARVSALVEPPVHGAGEVAA